jgi:hypothetical protein
MKNIRIIIFIGFLLRVLYAARIGYLGGADGLDMDAEGFYMRMVLIARSGVFEPMEVGEGVLLNSVGTLMGIFSDTAFFGCLLSCLAWLCSGLLFANIVDLTDNTNNSKIFFAALYAFWPTAIAYTVPTLREPYQLMFVNLALFGAMALVRSRQPIYWLLIILGLLGAGWLHGGLTAFSGVMLMLTILYYSVIGSDKIPVGRIFVAIGLATVVGYFGIGAFSSVSYNISDGVLESAQSYQGFGTELFGRTNYKDSSEATTGLSSIVFIITGLLQYLFEPMPYRVAALVDVALFFENVLRLGIILMAIIELRKSQKHSQRTFLAFLFCAYFSQEIIWSLGTVNWGTASRHHVPAMGLLLAMGAQAFLLRSNRLELAKHSLRTANA